MSDTTRLDLDALDECYHRGGQPTMDEGAALVARVRDLEAEVERLWGIVNERNAQLADGWQQRDDLADRAEAAEATIQRVRDLADDAEQSGWPFVRSERITEDVMGLTPYRTRRALDGGTDTEEADRG